MNARFAVPPAPLAHWLLTANLLGGSLGSAHALGPSDAQDKAYQCAVAGQTWGCVAGTPLGPGERIEERLEPGPRAAYAIHAGVPKDEAIAKARAAGEAPLRQVVRITTRQLSPAEQWDRVNGRYVSPWETVEVLSSTPDRGPAVTQGEKPEPPKR